MSIINYVQNSGFESGLTGWSGLGTSLNSSYSHTGVNSAQVLGGTTGSYIYQYVSVPEDNSFHLKISMAKLGVGMAPFAQVYVYYYTDGLVYQNTGLVASVPTRMPDAATNNWNVTYFNVAPGFAGSTIALVFITTYPFAGTADLLVDDIMLLDAALDQN